VILRKIIKIEHLAVEKSKAGKSEKMKGGTDGGRRGKRKERDAPLFTFVVFFLVLCDVALQTSPHQDRASVT